MSISKSNIPLINQITNLQEQHRMSLITHETIEKE